MASCSGSTTGRISINLPSTGYTYRWANSSSTSRVRDNLAPGLYPVTITQTTGPACTFDVTYRVDARSGVTINSTSNGTSVGSDRCNGNGFINLSVVNSDNSQLTYSWTKDGSTATWSTQDISGLSFGIYRVTVTSANGCSANAVFTVRDNGLRITATSPPSTAQCPATEIDYLTATGGSGNYVYEWRKDGAFFSNSRQIFNLLPGSYVLTVNSGDCSVTRSPIVIEPSDIKVMGSDASVCGTGNGTINITASGGLVADPADDGGGGSNNNYTYLWRDASDGTQVSTDQNFTGPPGIYTVVATENSGSRCKSVPTTFRIIAQPEPVISTDLVENVDCKGESTGAIILRVSNAVNPSFRWTRTGTSTTYTTKNLDNLPAGQYCVTVTNAGGCSDSGCFTISEPSDALAVTLNRRQPTCGQSNGRLSAVASGGTGGAAGIYSYLWSNNQTASTISNLAGGVEYCVTVQDQNDCSRVACATLRTSSGLTATASTSTASCGANNGSVNVNVTSGNGSYTYILRNAGGDEVNRSAVTTATSYTFNSLAAGDYSVIVTDGSSCSTTLTDLSVSRRANLTISGTSPTVCAGTSGQININVSGGTGSYTFRWFRGTTEVSQVEDPVLAAGSYIVQVTDQGGCRRSADFNVSTYPDFTPTLTQTRLISCNGVCDGRASVSIPGGTDGYTFSWNGQVGGSSLGGFCAGDYSVVITSPNGCRKTLRGTFTEPSPITLDLRVSASTCGEANARITAIPGGGTGGYTFNWAGGQTSATISNLTGGTEYCVTVTDANGCPITKCATPGGSNALAASFTTTAAKCGADNGRVTVNVTGGRPTYTYILSRSDGGEEVARETNAPTESFTFSNLAVGKYRARIVDGGSCVATLEEINVPGSSAITIRGSDITVCAGQTGQLNITTSGGGGGFTYSWFDGTDVVSNEQNPILGPGDYTVTVRSRDCRRSANFSVNTYPDFNPTLTQTSLISCNGVCDGRASVSIPGGTDGYTFSWNGQVGGSSLGGFCAGDYSVVVTSPNGCSKTLPGTFTEPSPITLDLRVSASTCGEANARITAIPGGGTGGYTFNWAGGQTSATISNLTGGTEYCVTIADANGCPITKCATPGGSNALAASFTTTAAKCGADNGRVTVNITGGRPSYTYILSRSEDGQEVARETDAPTESFTFSNLAVGKYRARIVDGGSCVATLEEINVTGSSAITIRGSDITVCAGQTGQLNITTSGGGGGFTYSWFDGTDVVSNEQNPILGPGDYTVTVRSRDCRRSANFSVNTYPDFNPTLTQTRLISCNGVCDGRASVSIPGGTDGYTFSWNGQVGGSSLGGFCAGDYSVVVTSPNGCRKTLRGTFTEPTPVTLALRVVASTCGEANARITAIPGGGTGGYTFNWAGGQTSATVSNLTGGVEYCVTVTDANGCPITKCATPAGSNALAASFTTTAAKCGADNGRVTVNVTGGRPTYTYTLSRSDGGEEVARETNAPTESFTFSNLAVGKYRARIVDGGSCVATLEEINVPGSSAITIRGSDITVCAGQTGQLNITTSGGGGGFTYSWFDGTDVVSDQQNPILGPGDYTVTVRSRDCRRSANFSVNTYPDFNPTLTQTSLISCNGVCDGRASVSIPGGTDGYTFSWNGQDGGSSLGGFCAGDYSVVVTSPNGCRKTLRGTFTEPTPVTLALRVVASTCGEANARITAIPGGGTGSYTFNWAGGQTSATVSNLTGGVEYCVTVTDANGCPITKCATPAGSSTLNASFTAADTKCGRNDGRVTFTVADGQANYTYVLLQANGDEVARETDAADSTFTFSNLAEGNYRGRIVDGGGCEVLVENIEVGGSSAITISGSDINVCTGQTGQLNITATGGGGSLTYSWSNGKEEVSDQQNPILGPGDYTVTVRSKDCRRSANFSVNTFPDFTPTLTQTRLISCNGVCDGRASVSIPGGTDRYTFSWNGQDGGSSLGGFCAGDYSVVVTSPNGCRKTLRGTFTEPTPVTLALRVVASTCGEANARITAIPGGGTGSYTFNWAGGQTSATVSNLTGGVEYCVTVTDANGCPITKCATPAGSSTLNASFTAADTKCGRNDGRVTFTVADGQANYTYVLLQANGDEVARETDAADSTFTFSNLAEGNYRGRIVDGGGCEVLVENIEVGGSSAITISGSDINVCTGQTGQLNITATGGGGSLTYSWSNGKEEVSDQQNPILGPGDYTVTVRSRDCRRSANFSVNTYPDFTPTLTQTRLISCNGVCDGRASVSIPGGTDGYTFSWNGQQGGSSFGGFCAGDYSVVVTSPDGCSKTLRGTFTEPSSITLDLSVSASTCGENNALITTTPGGGTGDYTYLWSNGLTTSTIKNLAGDVEYCVTVSDENNCSITKCATPGGSNALAASFTTADTKCGRNDGRVTFNVTDGQANYTYILLQADGDGDGDGDGDEVARETDAADSSFTFSNLAEGNYRGRIVDGGGCEVLVENIEVRGSSAITISGSDINVCTGQTGQLNITATGGGGSLTYSWSNGKEEVSDQQNPILGPGDYTVTVRSKDCRRSANFSVNTFPDFTPTLTQTRLISCNDVCDGRASVSIPGGTDGYTFSWNGEDGGSSLGGFCAGDYSVVVTSTDGCSKTLRGTFTEPSPITLDLSVSASTCGEANASVTAVPNGGTGDYTYLWSNGLTTSTVKNLAGGVEYCVTVSDENNCSITKCATPGGSNTLTASFTTADTKCGRNDGRVTFNVTDGQANYTYILLRTSGDEVARETATVDSSFTFSNLAEGNYRGRIIDGGGCEALVENIEVRGSSAITISGADINVCAGQTGQLNITATGGGGALTYSWSNGKEEVSDQQNPILGPGDYTVTVRSKDCRRSANFSVNTFPDFTPTLTQTRLISCNGVCDGRASVSIPGGTDGYTFSWSNNETGATATQLCAGPYQVQITSPDGCTETLRDTLTEPELLELTLSSTPSSCGQANAQASANASGGTPGAGYTYEWSDQAGTTQTVANLKGDTEYCVTVTDANGCEVSGCVTPASTPELIVTAASDQNASCDQNNGTITATVTSGTPDYTYILRDEGGEEVTRSQRTSVANYTFSDLDDGTYVIVVLDGNDCRERVANVAVNRTPGITITGRDVEVCPGEQGQFNVGISGGDGDYSIVWTNEKDTVATERNPTLPAGQYTINVTDGNECTQSKRLVITPFEDFGGRIQPINLASCARACDASLQVVGLNDRYEYTYSWSNGSDTATATNLCSGPVTVTVTSDKQCVEVYTFDLADPAEFTGEITGNVSLDCATDQTSLTAEVRGGTTPYRYEWSGTDASGATATQLSAGEYGVTVTDDNGCSVALSATVTAPDELVVSVEDVTVDCAGETATLTAITVGGTNPFAYFWDDNETASGPQIDATIGLHAVRVVDANGCEQIDSASVLDTPAFAVECSGDTVRTRGGSDGTISLTFVNGTPPFRYQIADRAPVFTNSRTVLIDDDLLSVGTYVITATDGNDCSATDCEATIPDLECTLAVTRSIQNVSCFGEATGTISLDILTDATSYAVVWTNDQKEVFSTEDEVSNLSAGLYSVVVTDATNCRFSRTFTVEEPTELSLVCQATATTDVGGNNGSVSLAFGGGVAPYSVYVDSTDQPIATQLTDTFVLRDLTAATYVLRIVDANDCSTECTSVVTDPACNLSVDATSTDPCFGTTTGVLDLTVTGATGGVTYEWSNGATSEDITGLNGGDYTVTVTDEANCVVVRTFSVTPRDELIISCSPRPTTSVGTSTGRVVLTFGDASPPFVVRAYLDDELIESRADINAERYVWRNLAAGTYSFEFTDSTGCSSAACTSTVLDPACDAPPTIGVATTDVTCFGGSDGSLELTVTGDFPPYVITWADETAGAVLSDLSVGTYAVTVTDARNCSTVASYEVGQPTELVVSGSTQQPAAADGAGSVELTVSGGTPPYSVFVNDEFFGADAGAMILVRPLPTGEAYTIRVVDSLGCAGDRATYVSDTITAVACALEVSLATPPPFTCAGEPVQLTATATNAVGTLSYVWSTGESGPELSSITVLEAGRYGVTVTDAANDCVAETAVTISDPAPTPITATCDKTDALIESGTGSVTLTVNGGTGPYTAVDTDTGDTTTVTELNQILVTGLAVGPYDLNFTVTDVNGCEEQVSCSGTIDVDPADCTDNFVVTLTADDNVLDCADAATTLTASVAGATGELSYSWSEASGESTENTIEVTGAGSYSVTVTDAATGCVDSASLTITAPAIIAATCEKTDALIESGTGSVTLTITGGAAPYTASNDGTGQTAVVTELNQIITADLPVGPYALSFTVTDANGCDRQVSCTGEIGVNPEDCASNFAVSLTADDNVLNCADGSTTLTTSVTGATGELTYAWSNGRVAVDLASIEVTGAADYSVTLTDAATGCVDSASLNVTAPAPITATCDKTDAFITAGTGSVTLTINGGTAPYTAIDDSTGQAAFLTELNQVIVDLPTGPYALSFTVTDANACEQQVTCSGTIEVDPEDCASNFSVSLTADSNVLACSDASTTLTATTTGATGELTYAWSDGQQAVDLTSVEVTGAASYSVTVTDAATGCVDSASLVVTAPTPITASCDQVNAFLATGAGSVTMTISGGTAPYTAVDDSTGELATVDDLNQITVTDLPVGPYTLDFTVTDASGCEQQVSCSGEINVDAEDCTSNFSVTLTADNSALECSDGSTTLTAVVTGGTGELTYVWSDGQQAVDLASITVNAAGSYSVTITDAATGCVDSASVSITAPVSITATCEKTNALIESGTGSVTLTISGGTAPYTAINDGTDRVATVTELNQIVTDLPVGAYELSFTVTDANGCEQQVSCSGEIEVDEVDCASNFFVFLTADSNVLDCSDGSPALTTSVTGAIGELTYAWSNGREAVDLTSIVVTGAANYSVTVTDAATGCVSTDSVEITAPTPIVSTCEKVDAFIETGTGSVVLTISGGTAPYAAISDSTGQAVTVTDLNQIITNVSVGRFDLSFSVTDANGCEQQVSCSGEIEVEGEDCAGNFFVTLTAEDNVLDCAEGATTLTASATGAKGELTYAWSDGQRAVGLTSIEVTSAANYSVTVTDAATGCVDSASLKITAPTPITATCDQIDAPSENGTGSVTLAISGGTVPYVAIDDRTNQTATVNEFNQIIVTDVPAGDYDFSFTVTDANGCEQQVNCAGTIGVDTEYCVNTFSVILTAENNALDCADAATVLMASVTGATGDLTYAWSDGQQAVDLVSIDINGAASYSVTVTDAATGCVDSASLVITAPAPITANCEKVDALIDNGFGSVTLTISGGTAPYTAINDSTNLAAMVTELNQLGITNLPVGAYALSFTVTDANGCEQQVVCSGEILVDPTDCTNTFSVDLVANENVLDCSDGSTTLVATVAGATGALTYAWSDGQQAVDLSSIQVSGAASYSVTVTDAATGCVDSASISITGPAPITSSCDETNARIEAGAGSVTLTITGGTAPYSAIDNNTNLAATVTELNQLVVTGLPVGAYELSFTVTDANGCEQQVGCSGEIEVEEEDCTNNFSVTLTADTNVLDCADGPTTLIATVAGATGELTYVWSDGQQAVDLSSIQVSGAASYSVTVTDAATGCVGTDSIVITGSAPITSSCDKTNARIEAGTGSVTLTIAGGTAPYSAINDSTNLATTVTELNQLVVTSLPVGAYELSFTVTDANGCEQQVGCSGEIEVEEEDCTNNFSVTLTADTNVLDCADGPTTLIATVAGATGELTYAWSDGQQAVDLSSIQVSGAASYSVTVTDAATGCVDGASISITGPAPITSSCDKTDALIEGGTGSVILTISGGTAPYTAINDVTGQAAAVTELNQITVTSLPTGDYVLDFTVTDANGCEQQVGCAGTIEIDAEDCVNTFSVILTADDNVLNCADGSTVLTATVAGATGELTYAWSEEQQAATSASIEVFGAGNYSVTITDAATGCVDSASLVITAPTAITAACDKTDALTETGTGSVTLTIRGGTAPYTAIDESTNQAATVTAINQINISGLDVGTYRVSFTVTDANGCEQEVSCSGEIEITPADCAGTFSVTLTANDTVLDCAGGSTTLVASATGATGELTYAWSNGRQAVGLSSIEVTGAADYSVTVTDVATGCIDSASITVTAPVAITTDCEKVDAQAEDGTGAVTLTISGGTAPYVATNLNTGQTVVVTALNQITVTDLAVGPYDLSFTVTDASGCEQQVGCAGEITIDAADCADSFSVTLTASDDVLDCADGSTTLTASVAGATGELNYAWSDGQQSPNLTSIEVTGPASYSVTVTDAVTGCVDSASITITAPATLSYACSTTQPSVAGGTGAVVFQLAGGTSPYGAVDQGGQPLTVDENQQVTIDGLPSGPYSQTISVTDANGCTLVMTCEGVIQAVVDCSTLLVSIEAEGELICPDDSIALTATVAGGSGRYGYLWSDGQTSNRIDNYRGGNYGVTVTDLETGCTDSASRTNPAPAAPALICTPINELVSTGNFAPSGGALIGIEGTNPPYSVAYAGNDYLLENGQTFAVAGLPVGDYAIEVVVTDANGCVSDLTCSGTITGEADPACEEVEYSLEVTPVTCNDAASGRFEIELTGGTAPYQLRYFPAVGTVTGPITQDNGNVRFEVNGLSAGSYSVDLTEAGGCRRILPVEIETLAPLELVCTSDTLLPGERVGQIQLSLAGESGPYTLYVNEVLFGSISAGASSVPNLLPGDYTLRVEDRFGCSTSCTASILGVDCTLLSPQLVAEGFDCADDLGSIAVSLPGVTITNYRWSTGATSPTLTGVKPGTYRVTLTTEDGCTLSNTITIDPVDPLVVTATGFNTSVAGGRDGNIRINIGDGNGPYVISLAGTTVNGEVIDSASTSDVADFTIDELTAGQYTVSVRDANGCRATARATVGNGFCEDYSVTCAVEPGTKTALIRFSGGAPVYRVRVTSGGELALTTEVSSDSIVISVGDDGVYEVTVTDGNGCERDCSFTIATIECENPEVSVTVDQRPTCDEANGRLTVDCTDCDNYSNDGGLTFQSSPVFDGLSAGIYRIVGRIGTTGCTTARTVSLESQTLDVEFRAYAELNADCTDGGDIVVESMDANLLYSIDGINFAEVNRFPNLAPGTYVVTATDSVNTCYQSYDTVVIESFEPLRIVVVQFLDAACFNEPGFLALSATGGDGDYTFTWDGEQGTPERGELFGTVAVVVTDGRGCAANSRFTFNSFPVFTLLDSLVADLDFCGDTIAELDLSTVITAGFAVEWSLPDGTVQQSPRLQSGVSGLHTVRITDSDTGCSLEREFDVNIAREGSIEPDILFASNYVMGSNGLLVIDITDSLPDSSTWELDPGVEILRISDDGRRAWLEFAAPGEYSIGIVSSYGGCTVSLYRTVTVTEADATGGGTVTLGDDVVDTKLWPNPHRGAFQVDLELREEMDAELFIINQATGQVVERRVLRGEENYREVPFDLVNRMATGLYIMMVRAGETTVIVPHVRMN
ncbi:SprB repeat-containing protein [Neolewinella antarctica]|uniref:HYR domain-containing protein n=1 Tax=Neolewinella antarctica TaxID=442734 RepID=A0ABX0XEY1_9BACT|nr:SprB repeat-containing protein [Neolewinella antarctica]NJC27680.1 hypothetical protein [Neolewinella antarctica]